MPLILGLAPPPSYYARSYLPEAADAEFDVVTHLKFAAYAPRGGGAVS